MITVARRTRNPGGEYVGRPTPLGNPFPIGKMTRDEVCDEYDYWLQHHLTNPKVSAELERLTEIARNRDLTLVCYCAPLRCHAESIKREIEKRLNIQTLANNNNLVHMETN